MPAAAYICFLSNPQNLNISSLLASIETSPFNVALERMPKPGCMIMVPTVNQPIHDRLWCVFEAYVALSKDIPIKIAGSPELLAVDRDAAAMQSSRMQQEIEAEAETTAEANRQLEEQVKDASCRNGASAFCVLLLLLCLKRIAAEGFITTIETIIHVERGIAIGLIAFVAIGVLGAIAAHHRRIVGKRLQECIDGRLIDIRQAKCTSDADKQRIHEAIRGNEDRINAMLGRCIVFGKPQEV